MEKGARERMAQLDELLASSWRRTAGVTMSCWQPEPVEDGTDLVITRTLKAPRALVWKMFSDPYHLAQWWGPKGFTNRVEKLDFRTGGSWLHVMIAPDGTELPTDNDIVEVTPTERIVYRNAPADPKIFGDNPPPAFTKTLTLAEVDGRHAADAALHLRQRRAQRDARRPPRLRSRHQRELRQARAAPDDAADLTAGLPASPDSPPNAP